MDTREILRIDDIAPHDRLLLVAALHCPPNGDVTGEATIALGTGDPPYTRTFVGMRLTRLRAAGFVVEPGRVERVQLAEPRGAA